MTHNSNNSRFLLDGCVCYYFFVICSQEARLVAPLLHRCFALPVILRLLPVFLSGTQCYLPCTWSFLLHLSTWIAATHFYHRVRYRAAGNWQKEWRDRCHRNRPNIQSHRPLHEWWITVLYLLIFGDAIEKLGGWIITAAFQVSDGRHSLHHKWDLLIKFSQGLLLSRKINL